MALAHWARQHDLVWVLVVTSALGFCWHHVKTSTAALSSVELGLNSSHCVGSFGSESCREGMRGWWPCRGGEERKSDRHAQLLSCLWTLLKQHCCLFQWSMTCVQNDLAICDDYGVLLGWLFFHAHILYQLPPCEWLCGIQLMVSDSSSILWVWSSLWLIWIQSPLTGLFSTGVYCSESDYNDSLLRKMVFHSIEGS